ncbi:BA75_03503T0 [Komagataella pastoris]|uniref:BA75_03503T0 n=1 Tax=Komagataella pastoris TaxID=4922 RepID=A0A1B2JG09_PICPA|nr:BA75_03503T0 [Komagataella pastoris]
MPIDFVGEKKYRLLCFLSPEVKGKDVVSVPLSGYSFLQVLDPDPSSDYLKDSIRIGVETQLQYKTGRRLVTVNAAQWRFYWKKKGEGVLYPLRTLKDFVRFVDILRESSFNSLRLVVSTDDPVHECTEERRKGKRKAKKGQKKKDKRKDEKRKDHKHGTGLPQLDLENDINDLKWNENKAPSAPRLNCVTIAAISAEFREQRLYTGLSRGEADSECEQDNSSFLMKPDEPLCESARERYKEMLLLDEEVANCMSEDTSGGEDYAPRSPFFIESMLSDSDFEQVF